METYSTFLPICSKCYEIGQKLFKRHLFNVKTELLWCKYQNQGLQEITSQEQIYIEFPILGVVGVFKKNVETLTVASFYQLPKDGFKVA